MRLSLATALLASLLCLAAPAPDCDAATINQPVDVSFANTLGDSMEIDLALLGEKVRMDCSAGRCACIFGDCSSPGLAWYRASTSSAGSNQWSAQLSKDFATPWTAEDLCVPGSDILDWSDDQYVYPDIWYVNGTEYRTGPTFTIRGGELQLPGGQKRQVPVEDWFRMEVFGELGTTKAGNWDLELRIPGRPVERMEGLPMRSDQFRVLDWVGFTSNAKADTKFYLDEIEIVNE